MKYTCEVTIDKPRAEVVEKLDNPDNMKYWQKGLISFEHLNGEPGKPGAESRLVYQMGKRRIEMIETITRRDLPTHFHAIYEAGNVWNEVRNTFTPTNDGNTLWISEIEFRFSGLFMRLMSWISPSSFKKQSFQFMQDFKAFVETGKSVRGE